MQAHELNAFSDTLGKSTLATDSFWALPLSQMAPMQVEFFYHRAKFLDKFEEAKALITELQQVVMASSQALDKEDMMIFAHRVPDPIFTVDELVDGLGQMTEVRQNALLFALETKLTPAQVINLRWNDPVQLPQTECVQILLSGARAHRHINLPYVFWEWSGSVAQPLLSLQEDAEMAFAKSWPGIVASYDDMVLISPKADAGHVKNLLNELSQQG